MSIDPHPVKKDTSILNTNDKENQFYPQQSKFQEASTKLKSQLQPPNLLTAHEQEIQDFQHHIDKVNENTKAHSSFQMNPFNNSLSSNSPPFSLNKFPHINNILNQGSQLVQKYEEGSIDDFLSLNKAFSEELNFELKQNYGLWDQLVDVGKLGAGSFGEVYLVFDKRSRQFFARKQLMRSFFRFRRQYGKAGIYRSVQATKP